MMVTPCLCDAGEAVALDVTMKEVGFRNNTALIIYPRQPCEKAVVVNNNTHYSLNSHDTYTYCRK